MTDEKLDQILKQALAPEISDREIRIHRRRKDKMTIFGCCSGCGGYWNCRTRIF